MKRITTQVYQGVRGYWRKRHYERLGGKSQRRFWRIRITPKLKLKLRFSPKRLLTKIRDAYVNIDDANGEFFVGCGVTVAMEKPKFGLKPAVKYDEKVILEFYKTLVTRQAQLVPVDDSHLVVSPVTFNENMKERCCMVLIEAI